MKSGDHKVDAVFRALADPTRRVILDELNVRGDQTLFEICVRLIEKYQLGLSRQAVSKHLAVLEAADLVRTRWQGRTKLHSLHATPIKKLGDGWLGKYMRDLEKRK